MKKLLFLLFLLFPFPVYANSNDINQMISENWNTPYNEIEITENSSDIYVDGKQKDFSSFFDVPKEETNKILKDEENIKDYFQDFPLDTKNDGTIVVQDPYQTKRIVIPAKNIPYYGETDRAVNELFTVLQFSSSIDTKNAFESISQTYPNAFVDEYISSDEVSKEFVSWGNNVMHMEKPKKQNYGNRKVTVAIIDSGLDNTNPLFSNREISPDSYNFVDNNYDYRPYKENDDGHGTHVAGIIADATPNNVVLMPLNIFDKKGDSTYLRLAQAFLYAVNHADVINCSLGMDPSNDVLDDIIQKAVKKNVVIFAASGNEETAVCYPANNENTFAIGSMGHDYSVSSYSNYGKELDFVAPGEGIKSAGLNGKYTYGSGTSMSTPHMTAAGAYLKLMYPNITFKEMYNYFKKASVDIEQKGWDSRSGWGYVDFSLLIKSNPLDEISNISFPDKTVTYNGNTQYCEIKGNLPSDYNVKYTGYKNAGTYTVYAKIYKGTSLITTKSANLTIKKAKLSNINLKETELEYCGYEIYPSFSYPALAEGNYTFSCKNAVRPGTATLVVSGKNNFEGTVSLNYNIVDTTTFDFQDYETDFTGQEETGVCSGEYVGDLKLTYAKKPGIHTVTAELYDTQGLYKRFYAKVKINKLNIEKAWLEKTTYNYNGKTIYPKVSYNPGTTFKTIYSNNNKPGYGTVTLTGTGYYTGTLKLKYIIKPKITSIKKKGKKAVIYFKSKGKTKIYKKHGKKWKLCGTTSKNFFVDKKRGTVYKISCNGIYSKVSKIK